MHNILLILQIVLATFLSASVLIQAKGKGFGRSTNVSFTRRGLEKIVFRFTFVLAAAFVIVSILQVTL